MTKTTKPESIRSYSPMVYNIKMMNLAKKLAMESLGLDSNVHRNLSEVLEERKKTKGFDAKWRSIHANMKVLNKKNVDKVAELWQERNNKATLQKLKKIVKSPKFNVPDDDDDDDEDDEDSDEDSD